MHCDAQENALVCCALTRTLRIRVARALLNFLLPEVFADSAKFDEWFGLAGDAGEGKQKEVVAQLHKVLRPFLLRRLKADVEKGLPPKKETILKVGLTDMQRHYYKSLIQKDIEAIQGGGGDRSRLLNIVMQLRKCCNHPYLFAGAEPGPPFFMGEHLVENAGKMILLDKLLPRLRARDSRVLIFSQMTRMLDVLEDYLHWRGYSYCRIDGNTNGDDREASIEAFNAPGSEKFVFLLSTRAGGLGINLATADTVVLYDSDWNPQMDLQAMDRAHRIGQTKEVQVFRFMTEDSVEVKVIEKAYKKLALDALVIQQGRLQDAKGSVGKEDLLQMVRYGAEKIFSGASGAITSEDIDTILQKGEADTQALSAKMDILKDAAMKFSMEGDKTLYDFEAEAPPLLGEEGAGDGAALDMRRLAAAHWVEPPKREKKMRSYNENEVRRASRRLHLPSHAHALSLLTRRSRLRIRSTSGSGCSRLRARRARPAPSWRRCPSCTTSSSSTTPASARSRTRRRRARAGRGPATPPPRRPAWSCRLSRPTRTSRPRSQNKRRRSARTCSRWASPRGRSATSKRSPRLPRSTAATTSPPSPPTWRALRPRRRCAPTPRSSGAAAASWRTASGCSATSSAARRRSRASPQSSAPSPKSWRLIRTPRAS
jgi:superfamily II DNA/RNA helicase